MTDERDESSEWRLQLSRRDFLQLGLASPLLVQDFVTQDPDPPQTSAAPESSPPSHATGRSIDTEATDALRPPPTERRDYFPLESELVSIRGLAPPQDARISSDHNVWLNGQTISLRNLAAWRSSADPAAVFDGTFPHSVRELITPQMLAPTEPSLGELIEDWGSSAWKNWLGDYTQQDAVGVDFEEAGWVLNEERIEKRRLIGYLEDAAKREAGFRAVGSGHSHSEAARPEKYYTDMKTVSGTLEQKWLRDSDDSFWKAASGNEPSDDASEDESVVRDHLIRLGAGTILKTLNRDILPDENLALPNMGAWDGQTLAGAINTSTHGTGLGLGTFADLVRSVEIITIPESQYEEGRPYVRLLRIEPTDGITDPAKFARDTSTHDMGLIQDDDLFHSVVVGYGCMGIVHAYTLELQKPYWLHEENDLKRWDQFDSVQGADTNRHYSIYVDLIEAQLGETSNPLCLVRTRNEAEADGRTPTERSNPGNITERITESWTGASRAAATGSTQRLEQFLEEYAEQISQIEDVWQGIFSGNIPQIFGFDPPFRGQRCDTASYIALRRRKARYPDQPDKPPKPPGDVITTEIGVPVSKVRPAVDRVIEFATANRRFFPAPLGVRFTDGSQHFFSPEYDRAPEYDGPTAMLELPLPNPDRLQNVFADIKTKHDTPGPLGPVEPNPVRAFLQDLKRINQESRRNLHDQETGVLDHFLNLEAAKAEFEKLEDILIREFDGRPHMGKHNTVNVQSGRAYMRPQNMYPEYEKWLDAYRYLNQFGTFDGAFSENKTT